MFSTVNRYNIISCYGPMHASLIHTMLFWLNIYTYMIRWTSRRGRLFLSNIRLVYLADQADAGSGLACFDFPLVYINRDSLNQPIFGSNNISGEPQSSRANFAVMVIYKFHVLPRYC